MSGEDNDEIIEIDCWNEPDVEIPIEFSLPPSPVETIPEQEPISEEKILEVLRRPTKERSRRRKRLERTIQNFRPREPTRDEKIVLSELIWNRSDLRYELDAAYLLKNVKAGSFVVHKANMFVKHADGNLERRKILPTGWGGLRLEHSILDFSSPMEMILHYVKNSRPEFAVDLVLPEAVERCRSGEEIKELAPNVEKIWGFKCEATDYLFVNEYKKYIRTVKEKYGPMDEYWTTLEPEPEWEVRRRKRMEEYVLEEKAKKRQKLEEVDGKAAIPEKKEGSDSLNDGNVKIEKGPVGIAAEKLLNDDNAEESGSLGGDAQNADKENAEADEDRISCAMQ